MCLVFNTQENEETGLPPAGLAALPAAEQQRYTTVRWIMYSDAYNYMTNMLNASECYDASKIYRLSSIASYTLAYPRASSIQQLFSPPY